MAWFKAGMAPGFVQDAYSELAYRRGDQLKAVGQSFSAWEYIQLRH